MLVHIPVEVLDEKGNRHKFLSVNASGLGLAFAASRPFPVGQHITLWFTLPSGITGYSERRWKTTANVEYCRRPLYPGGYWVIGVEFLYYEVNG